MLPTRPDVEHQLAHYFPIQDGTGQVKQLGVMVVGNTGRRRLEQAITTVADKLQQEKARLQAVLEVSAALAESKADFEQAFPAIFRAFCRKAVPRDSAFVTQWWINSRE